MYILVAIYKFAQSLYCEREKQVLMLFTTTNTRKTITKNKLKKKNLFLQCDAKQCRAVNNKTEKKLTFLKLNCTLYVAI